MMDIGFNWQSITRIFRRLHYGIPVRRLLVDGTMLTSRPSLP